METSSEMGVTGFALQKAILIYGKRRGSLGADSAYGRPSERTTFASIHDVAARKDNGQILLNAGEPATVEGIRQLKESFDGRSESHFLPENVLAHSAEKLVFYLRPQKHVHFFSKGAGETLHALDGSLVPCPALVFHVSATPAGGSLSVYAIRQQGRPDLNTILYHAPFYNVNSRGSVCHGSMSTPDSHDPSTTEGWVESFFASVFTHGSGVRFLKGEKGYGETLADLVESGADRFPTKRLRRTGARLRSII